ncbi:MAG: IS66 family insertion sequence element accessory protein TnpA [Acetobacteraceae bacterium]
MAESGRQRRNAQAWDELVKRQNASGLSAQAFCRREGISAWMFYRWRSRLRVGRSRQPESRALAGEAAPFIELGALRSPGAQRWEVRLDLGAGIVLHLVRG